MTELQKYLNEVKDRLGNATSAPWKFFKADNFYDGDSVRYSSNNKYSPYNVICCNQSYYPSPVQIKDMRLIANAPTDIKILVEMVEFYHNIFELHPDDMEMFITKISKHKGDM